jgi:hypothetical protein
MVLAAQRRLRNSAHMKARLARRIGRQVIRHVTIAAKDHGVIPVPKLWITRLGKSNCTTVGTRHAHCRRFRLFVASHLNSGFGDEVSVLASGEGQHGEIGDERHDDVAGTA